MREAISPDRWFEFAMSPTSLFRDWAEHAASFWALRDRPNVLVLHYSEMKADLPRAVDAISEVMGVALTPSERAAVVERGSFAWMKAHESQFAPPRLPILTGKERGQMLRSGRSGDSGSFMSPAQADALDGMILEELAALGSDFPYAELYLPAAASSRRSEERIG